VPLPPPALAIAVAIDDDTFVIPVIAKVPLI